MTTEQQAAINAEAERRYPYPVKPKMVPIALRKYEERKYEQERELTAVKRREFVEAATFALSLIPEPIDLNCMVCGKEFKGEEPIMCCNGSDCGCMGMPSEPVVCSAKCYYELPGIKSQYAPTATADMQADAERLYPHPDADHEFYEA